MRASSFCSWLEPQIPTILWAIVFVSGGILLFLQVGDSQSQRKIIRRTVLAAVTVLMTVEVASLAVLDHPFSPVARIQPNAMTDAIALLEAWLPRATYPARLWSVGNDQLVPSQDPRWFANSSVVDRFCTAQQPEVSAAVDSS